MQPTRPFSTPDAVALGHRAVSRNTFVTATIGTIRDLNRAARLRPPIFAKQRRPSQRRHRCDAAMAPAATAPSIEKVQAILLLGSPGSRWIPLLLPGGVRPRFCLSNLRALAPQLGSNRKSLVIVGTCVNEPSRWSPTDRQLSLYCTRRSCFAPISSGGPSWPRRRWWWRRRGTAPRVRNAYSTQSSTDIASCLARVR